MTGRVTVRRWRLQREQELEREGGREGERREKVKEEYIVTGKWSPDVESPACCHDDEAVAVADGQGHLHCPQHQQTVGTPLHMHRPQREAESE